MVRKTIKFKKLVPEATLPSYAHDGDIGMDVFAVGVEYDRENDAYIYHTGLACETSGHMGVLGMMKSSVYKHRHAFLVNGVGLIDSDQFRGEICFIYKNRTGLRQRAICEASMKWHRKPLWYKWTHDFKDEIEEWLERFDPMIFAPYQVGEAVGQLVPLTFDQIDIQEVTELSKTERGTRGFGSSKASRKKPTKNMKKYTPKSKEQ